MLRGMQPKDIPKRLKLLLYGPAGVGKTVAAIQMPQPYVIDCERGTDHYGHLIDGSGEAVFQTTVMAELISEVRSLVSEEHDYRTLLIDPITTVYQDLLDACEKEVGTKWGRHYGAANQQMKRLGIDRALSGVEDIADLPDERIVNGIQLIESHLSQTTTTNGKV